MCATRDLLRRRGPLRRQRAELLAHIQNTNSPDTLPEMGKQLAYKAKRQGGAEHFPDPSVRKPIAVEGALIAHAEQLLGAGELSIPRTAKPPAVQPFARRQSVPGLGQL